MSHMKAGGTGLQGKEKVTSKARGKSRHQCGQNEVGKGMKQGLMGMGPTGYSRTGASTLVRWGATRGLGAEV